MTRAQAVARQAKGRLDGLRWGLARAAVSTAVLGDPLDTTRARAAQTNGLWVIAGMSTAGPPVAVRGAWRARPGRIGAFSPPWTVVSTTWTARLPGERVERWA
jgi:hypothetical protein